MSGERTVEVVHPRFAELVHPHARPECIYDGGLWLEGPLWLEAGRRLLFSDIPRDRVLAWSPEGGVEVFSEGGFQNGRTLDAAGRLIACEHGGRRVVAVGADGAVQALASHYGGNRLNSPNDVVARADGSLWFTDPDYGILSDYEGYQAPSEQPCCHVFRLDAGAAQPEPVVMDMVKPNGLAFSPDGRWLYVAESGASHVAGTPSHIRRFGVRPDGSLAPAGVLATLDCGVPDGLRADVLGNVWSSAGDGVHCFSPEGTLLGKLRLGCVASNLCFGGPGRRRLFITTARCVVTVDLAIAGQPEGC